MDDFTFYPLSFPIIHRARKDKQFPLFLTYKVEIPEREQVGRKRGTGFYVSIQIFSYIHRFSLGTFTSSGTQPS